MRRRARLCSGHDRIITDRTDEDKTFVIAANEDEVSVDVGNIDLPVPRVEDTISFDTNKTVLVDADENFLVGR